MFPDLATEQSQRASLVDHSFKVSFGQRGLLFVLLLLLWLLLLLVLLLLPVLLQLLLLRSWW